MTDSTVAGPETGSLETTISGFLSATAEAAREPRERLAAAAGRLQIILPAARSVVSAATSEDAWGSLDSIRPAMDAAMRQTKDVIAGPLDEALRELALGELLCGCLDAIRSEVFRVAVERTGPPADGETAGEEDPALGARCAFLRHLATETVPDAARVALRDATVEALERVARATSELTRWKGAVWAVETRLSEEPASEGAIVQARLGVERSGESLLAELVDLDAWLRSDPLDDVVARVGGALTDAGESFDPAHRRWRHASLEPMEPAAGRGASQSPLCDPDRFEDETRRVRLVTSALGFDAFLGGFAREVLLDAAERGARDGRDALKDAEGTLRALATELEAAFADLEEGAASPDVRRSLRQARAALAKAERRLEAVRSDSTLQDGVVDAIRVLQSTVDELPEALSVSPLLDEGERPKLEAGSKRLSVRWWARETFHPAILDELARCDEPYLEALGEAAERFPRSRHILEYNLGAACDPSELPADRQADLQRELATKGLTRAADAIGAIRERLQERTAAASEPPLNRIRERRRRFRERAAAEGSLESQAWDAWDSVRRRGRKGGAEVGRQLGRGRRTVETLLRFARGKLLRLFRAARARLGTAPVDERRAQGTTQALSEIDVMAEKLPFVYRRLFSYGPLEDPALLVGRAAEADILDRLLAQWEGGAPESALLVGTSGVGLTSLMRTTQERWLGRVDWRSVPLNRRIEREEEWAKILGSALDLSHVPTSLSELEDALSHGERPPIARVCAIDNLEHLYLRGVLATGLIAPTLKLFAATDANVLWLASVSARAWEVIRATDPGLSAILRIVSVPVLGRSQVELVVRARHERSGMSLSFEEPPNLPLGVRRQLGRANAPEARGAVLERAYFDRLYELSEGYVSLALLYWLRSVHVDPDGESVRVRWPDRLDFAAWDELDADAGFALRALLEHGSLTLSEYARVFGTSEATAYATFERLGDFLVIEPLGYRRRIGSPLSFHRVKPTERYRIRPVLVRPVERLLESRRLVY